MQKDNPQNWYLYFLLFVLTSKSRFFSTFSIDWLIVSSKLHETRWYYRMKLIMIYYIELDSNTLIIFYLIAILLKFTSCISQNHNIFIVLHSTGQSHEQKVRLPCRAKYMYSTTIICTYHHSLTIKCFNIVNTSQDIWTKLYLWVSPHICSIGF